VKATRSSPDPLPLSLTLVKSGAISSSHKPIAATKFAPCAAVSVE